MKQSKLFPAFILLLAELVLVACGRQAAVAGTPTEAPLEPATETKVAASGAAEQINCTMEGETVEFAEARLYVEYNATDGDLGVHGEFGDDGWSELCVYAPSGDQILGVRPQSQLGELTVGSIFFESREPELPQFSLDDLVASFPEGQYEVHGLSHDGLVLTGAATFTHAVPVEPDITSPALAEDEETAGEALVSNTGLMVTWEDVTETVNSDPVKISGYEVIITKVDHEDPHGFSRPIYDVHVPPDLNSLSVPAEFLELDTVYELEVLALEESGNQTISVGFFKTE